MTRRALFTALLAVSSVGCNHKLSGDKPSLSKVAPAAACNLQKTSALTVTGAGLSPLPTQTLTDKPALVLPRLTLTREKDLSGGSAGGAAIALPDDGTHVRWSSEQQMSFDVYPELGLSTGLYALSVANGNGATANLQDALLLVPPPKLTKLDDDLVCSDQAGTLTLTGEDFLKVGATLPTVEISGGALSSPVTIPAADLAGCTALPGGAGLQACTTLHFPLVSGQLPVGSYQVKVLNPEPVGCSSSEPITLTVVPPPSVAAASQDLLCTADGVVPLTLTGQNFLAVGTAQPSVTLQPRLGGGAVTNVPATVDDSSCTAVAGLLNEQARLCTSLTLHVPTTVTAGTYQVIVNDAPPAACSSTEDVEVTVVPGPAIASLAPTEACDNSSATSVTVTGTNFITVAQADGGAAQLPTVAIGTQPALAADSVSNCTAVSGPAESVQACTTLVFTVSQALATALTDGDYPVVIENPAPADCSSQGASCPGAQCLLIAPPPRITGIAPTQICGNGGQLDLQGVGLADGTLTLTPGSGAVVTAPVTLEPDGGAAAQVPGLDPGAYQATYAIAGGTCTAEADGGGVFSQTIDVVPGPQLFFADPRVVYSGITTEVTFYGASISGTVQSLQIAQQMGDGGLGTPVALTNINSTPGANLVRADVPSGLPAGTYDVLLTDDTSCPAELPGGLVITDNLSLTIASISPPFGYELAQTAVTITGAAHGTFKPLPQAYLNPHSAGTGVVATPIRALALNEPSDTSKPDTLTGIVGPLDAATPLSVGVYDLIVVNPDGTVGLLQDAFTVTGTEPPSITNVSPGSFSGGSSVTLTVTGANFASGGAAPDGGSLGSATLDLSCVAAGTTTPVSSYAATSVAVDGSGTGLTGTVNVLAGQICVVRVTNPDGTYADFASVVTTNPSGNLSPFSVGPDLLTPRAALQAAAGNATSAARFLYAIGGNDGTSVLSSVESSPVDLYGTPIGFSSQRYGLTEGSADAGVDVPRENGTAVTVGRFVYAVGGSDGANPLATVDRAEILDPSDSPQVSNLALNVDADGGGMAPGVWYYRVGAVLDPSDANNPGGETIAGDAFGLQLCNPSDAQDPTYCPNLAGKRLDVTLTWTPVADAVSYRIYRTASPDQTPDQAVLLAEVPSSAIPLAFTDDGTAAPGTLTPLDVGALGRWSTVATLAKPRSGPAVTTAAEPGDPTQVYLYAFGGLTTGGTLLGDYEFLTLQLGTDAFGRPSQSVTGPTAGNSVLEQKSGNNVTDVLEWLNLAFTGTSENAPTIPPGQVYVYVAPGATNAAGTTAASSLDFATLSAGASGQLSALAPMGTQYSGGNEGYGGTLVAGYINFFGGGSSVAGPAPSGTWTAAQLCGGGICPTVTTPTDVKNFNNNGAGLTSTIPASPPRVEMGTAVQSGTIYVLGGWTASGPSSLTATMVYTYW